MKKLILALGILCAICTLQATDLSKTTVLGFYPGQDMLEALNNPFLAQRKFESCIHQFLPGRPETVTAAQAREFILTQSADLHNRYARKAYGTQADRNMENPNQLDIGMAFAKDHPQLLGLPIESIGLVATYSPKQKKYILHTIHIQWAATGYTQQDEIGRARIRELLKKELGPTDGYGDWSEPVTNQTSRLHAKQLGLSSTSMELSYAWGKINSDIVDEQNQEDKEIAAQLTHYNPQGTLSGNTGASAPAPTNPPTSAPQPAAKPTSTTQRAATPGVVTYDSATATSDPRQNTTVQVGGAIGPDDQVIPLDGTYTGIGSCLSTNPPENQKFQLKIASSQTAPAIYPPSIQLTGEISLAGQTKQLKGSVTYNGITKIVLAQKTPTESLQFEGHAIGDVIITTWYRTEGTNSCYGSAIFYKNK